MNTEAAAQLLSAMANENRLKVLCLLAEGERTVSELGAAISLAQSPLSQHLAKLRVLDFVRTRRDGQMVYYSLTSPALREMVQTLTRLFPASQH